MNKLTMTLIATSILSVNIALADAKVYGKVNLTLNTIDEENDGDTVKDNIELKSNASRLGFKGDADLTDNLKAVAKIEYEVGADDGVADDDGDELKARNVYAGLKGDWGQVVAGRKDTPLKALSSRVDQFNDYFLGDVTAVITGEERLSNMVQYSSPSMSGVIVNVMAAAGEESGAGKDDDSGLDSLSASVDYKADAFSVALALDNDVNGIDAVRLVGNWMIDDITLGALVQQSELSDAEGDAKEDQTGIIVSAAYKMDSWVFKAQYGMSETETQFKDDNDADILTLGVDYKLAKTSRVYGYYSMLDETLVSVEGESSTFGLGFEHNF